MNIYKKILQYNLPRLYALYDLDSQSSTYGYGDRLYWGWKISDFSNGTFQGGVHAIAIAIKLNIAGNESFALKVVDAAISSISMIRRKNGSLEEAFPNENSFCVTALVAFDVIAAIEHLQDRISSSRKLFYLETIEPLIRFIIENEESHAFISNHLAAAYAALTLWNKISGAQYNKSEKLLDAILEKQSSEGWYLEYEGADPGYQTLAIHYLYAATQCQENNRLKRSLCKSIEFLRYFCFPDGSIGGLYGSRNTEVYYPGGIVGLSGLSEKAKEIANILHYGVEQRVHILPQDIDSGNFIPLINSYAVAALELERSPERVDSNVEIGSTSLEWKRRFTHAGLYIHSTERYYAITNYKKGGTLKVYDRENQCIDLEDGGIFGRLKCGHTFSTQHYRSISDFKEYTVESDFFLTNVSKPSPFKFILLRILSLTLFNSISIGNAFKKAIVRMLMTGKKQIDGKAKRKFIFHKHRIVVEEKVTPPLGTVQIGHPGKCRSIHMASSGYFLKQDQTRPTHSRIVEFSDISE